MTTTDTIAAIATGGVISAIGIVRVSGEKAIPVADKIFKASGAVKLTDAQNRHMYYGELRNAGGELLDICLCVISRSPNSYTGEDTVEFHCHGSPIVLSEVIQTLYAQGVRQAQAGEFTKRAFLNGRMDLTQAEAVIDLIEAETPPGAKNAAGQLRGAVCEKISGIYDELLDIIAHFHAQIDYPDDDIEEFETENYLAAISGSIVKLQRLLDTHERGKMLRTGIPTVITGRTNTGKSSLFNALTGFERAIVTDIAGTTRDTIEEKILLGNILLRLVDTAGLRKTDDTVERLGTQRARAALDDAALILLVLDSSVPLQEDDYNVLRSIPPAVPVIIILNKSDKPQAVKEKDVPADITRFVRLSALTGEGLDRLISEIQKLFPDYSTPAGGEVITSIRQAQAIGRAIGSMELAQKALREKVSADAVLTDIETALSALGEITGKTLREDIITKIFERFCVGK